MSGHGPEAAMLAELCAAGAPALVANVASSVFALEVAGEPMPVTVDSGALGGSYVSSPHSAYALYARAELELVDVGALAAPARVALAGVDRLLRAAAVNRAVHLNNWLLSTNLHGAWRGQGLSAARHTLTTRFPGHLLGVRSVDDWSAPGLRAALEADGWILVPSRRIWVVEDLARQWRPRGNFGHDRRAVARSGLTLEDLTTLTPGDAQRIAHLYALLYMGRYSPLNPVLTPAFIEASWRTGFLSYRVARAPDGQIMAVAGMWVRGGVMTPPVVGYDTARPQREALYRVACWLFMERALALGVRLHGSSGAAHFKRQRGAQGFTEYNAYFAAHLPPARGLALRALAKLLKGAALPVMIRRGL
ncbi:GNAT family N-acetyltransferase [Deinococcus aquaedulcis]|uniref:GNAT family N-acetyltransferase n=1 Tax=Deinococcus aquaedulcis TaxID=2840455 RepID=UPI001C83089B|nr:GNAT family N-acetyltransferase [Deinococcus aquaedulcis]